MHARIAADARSSPSTWAFPTSTRVAALRGARAEADAYRLDVDGEEVEIGAVSIGNPHAVLSVQASTPRRSSAWAARSSTIRAFRERVNVGFMQIIDRARIRLRVYERGVGETLACGTGACAAVAVGAQRAACSTPTCK